MPRTRRKHTPARTPATPVRFLALCDQCRTSQVYVGPDWRAVTAAVTKCECNECRLGAAFIGPRLNVEHTGWTCSRSVELWDHGEADDPVWWWCGACSAARVAMERKTKRAE